MKIGIVTPRFAIAGVPLAQIRFARAFARRGYEVTLVVGYVEPSFQFPDLSEVTVRILGIPRVRSMLWPLMHYLLTEKPDIVFSAEDHLNTLLLIAAMLVGSKAKISGSSRVTPYDTYSNVPFTKRWVLKHLTRTVMWRADALTCVSKEMVAQYQHVFVAPLHVCVYNIVDDALSRARLQEPVDHPWLVNKSTPVMVAAGRLAPWKGFADLIEATALLVSKRQIRLLILGDGPLRIELQTLIDARGLRDVVQLVGYVENPLRYFARADVFVLSSYVEGLPNVLVEAMMCGCTPVSTDCPTGPREVLQGGRYGYLVKVGDHVGMADGIGRALDFPIAKELLDAAVQPFEESTVLRRHFEVLGIAEGC
jgi:glycosyltransferase involved in cell wall biosynthesis